MLVSCVTNSPDPGHSISKEAISAGVSPGVQPETLVLHGDFDGDGQIDALKQFLADSTGKPVFKLPKFPDETWEDVVAFYSRQGYYTAIVLDNNRKDTLKFYNAQGLYCLINLGDRNKDARDEIALVPDLLDFSRHNYCRIYSLCGEKWTELFRFSIHEGAFDYVGDKSPIFGNIPEALEKRGSKWYYHDYLDMEYETEEQVGKMKELPIRRCGYNGG